MLELVLGGLCSAPLSFLLSSLPGNYSPDCASGFYRDPSSASPSSSWRIWQLLLLPLLFLQLPGPEAAESSCPCTFPLPALLQLLCHFPSLGVPLPSSVAHTWSGLLPHPGVSAGSPGSAYSSPNRGSSCSMCPGLIWSSALCKSPHQALPSPG